MDNNKIGKFIAVLRKKKGLTQKELGDKLFVTDKAVSKWERGLSLPDIAILERLALELDTDIYHILQIEKKNDIDVEKIIREERLKMKKQVNRKILIICFLLFLFVGFILFKFVSFGYQVYPIRYTHNTNKLIHLGVPKYSFWFQNVEDSYSFKSFRGSSVLKHEMRNYLNTLDKLSCNHTSYYYDSLADITFVDYQVQGNLFYHTLTYSVRNGNYCNTLQVEEYTNKLGSISAPKNLYAEDSLLHIYLDPSLKVKDHVNEWTIVLYVYYQTQLIEESKGTFEINGNELTYYRTTISKQDEELDIPTISNFIIKDQKLILEDNYLDQYEKSIILK